MIANPASLPIPAVVERASKQADSKIVFGNYHLQWSEGALPIIQISSSNANPQEGAADKRAENSTPPQLPNQKPTGNAKTDPNQAAPSQTGQQQERRERKHDDGSHGASLPLTA